MPLNPGQSREAHSQIGMLGHVAASPQPPTLRPSPAPGSRDPYPAAGRGAAAGQQASEPSWAEIGLCCVAVIALWLFLFALDSGQIAGAAH